MIRIIAACAALVALSASACAQGTFPSLAPPNQVIAGPNGGSPGVPAPRALVLPDLPFTLSGNTSVLATVSGTLTNGHCLSAGSSQNIVDGGGPCTTGGGGGTVNSATIGQYAIYTGATAVSGVTLSGDLSCNSSGVCTLAAVSNAKLATMAADTIKCNNTTSTAAPTDCTKTILGGTFVASPDYGASNGQSVGSQAVVGSSGSPSTLGDAPVIAQKFSNISSATDVNPTNYAAAFKFNSTVNGRAVAFFGDGVDEVGGFGSFVEGGRFQANLAGGASGEGNGVICGSGTTGGVGYAYLIGCEADLENNSGTDATLTFSSSKFAIGFLASCGEGTNKCDAGFALDPFDTIRFLYGFIVPASSIDSTGTAFASNASANFGLDVSNGTWASGAIAIPNTSPILAKNGAGSGYENIMYLNSSNQLILGAGTASPGVTKICTSLPTVVGGVVTSC